MFLPSFCFNESTFSSVLIGCCDSYSSQSRMNFNSFQISFRKKLSHSVLQKQSPCFRLYYSHNPTHTSKKKNKLDKALRVIELISPKEKTNNRQSHLQLIGDFLQPDSVHFSSEKIPVNRFDKLFESSYVPFQTSAERLRIDATDLSISVSSCALERNLRGGIQYHCAGIRTGFLANVYVGSSLINFYGKCNELENAYRVFEEMPIRNVVSWTAIIVGFAQECHVDMCFELFHRMRHSTMEPNDFTFASILSACTGSGALGQGKSVHCQTIQLGFDSYIHISNALVSIYCKCGAVGDALYIFKNLDGKDTISWNSMIAGYAQHGLALKAIDLFEEMKKQNVKADAITFLGILSSCRHAGLVKEGWFYFNSMVKHGVQPELDHYSCIIDLLGRAGFLEEARDVIEKMPICPNAVIWGSLLSSCRVHGSVWFGIEAAEGRLLLEPSCAATHVQLANLYASVGCWDDAARVRKFMKDKGLKTSPGYSWIELQNKVYQFGAEDKSNTKMLEILFDFNNLVDHITALGYDPEIYGDEEDYVLYSTQ